MFLSVKSLTMISLSLAFVLSAFSAQAELSKFVYVEPGVSASLHEPFTQVVHQHPIWHLPVASGQVQIVRLQSYVFQEAQPFYWIQTRLDERSLRLEAKVSLEIWEGQALVWQKTQQLHRDLRLMGRELRGIGQPIAQNLGQLPRGALTTFGIDSQVYKRAQSDLFTQALHQLRRDYAEHNKE